MSFFKKLFLAFAVALTSFAALADDVAVFNNSSVDNLVATPEDMAQNFPHIAEITGVRHG